MVFWFRNNTTFRAFTILFTIVFSVTLGALGWLYISPGWGIVMGLLGGPTLAVFAMYLFTKSISSN